MSTLRLYNTLTRKKEDFVPLDAKNVRMYVCGPTVYDFAHIGNARPVIVFDVLFRLLRHLYGEKHVTYVRNITDVDDKINARAMEIAKERKIPVMNAIREITAKTAKQYEEDVTALGCLKPTFEPRATDHIKQMIVLIEKLIAAKHAYVAEGHVLYDVSSKPDYGKLSRRSLDEMIAGARVEVAPYKKNPMDFVLWKPSTPELPGWDSKWGRGRPGWHTECSAMAEEYLGETFDIHGGGIDLLFPHHENEIAQSEGAHPNAHFARVWMHNGFLQVEGDKMSKSLGNFVTIREILNRPLGLGAAVRTAMLMTHYRQPMDWTSDRLSEAYGLVARWDYRAKNVTPSGRVPDGILEALTDDLNTPSALTVIHDLWHKSEISDDARQNLADGLALLGIQTKKFKTVAETLSALGLSIEELYEKINLREAARKAKNFKESDRIRDELESKGIILKDNPDGTTTWEVKR